MYIIKNLLLKVNSSGITAESKSWLQENFVMAIIIFVIGIFFGMFLKSTIHFLIDFFKENKDMPEDDKKEDE